MGREEIILVLFEAEGGDIGEEGDFSVEISLKIKGLFLEWW